MQSFQYEFKFKLLEYHWYSTLPVFTQHCRPILHLSHSDVADFLVILSYSDGDFFRVALTSSGRFVLWIHNVWLSSVLSSETLPTYGQSVMYSCMYPVLFIHSLLSREDFGQVVHTHKPRKLQSARVIETVPTL